MSDTRQHLLDNILSIIADLEAPPMVKTDAPEDGALQDQAHLEAQQNDAGEWTDETGKVFDVISCNIFNTEDETWHDEYGDEIEIQPMGAFDYIQAQLSIEFTCDSQRQFLGGEILCTFGGPNIWIDTRHNTVIGTWGSDRITRSYTDNIGLDDAMSELWDMGA